MTQKQVLERIRTAVNIATGDDDRERISERGKILWVRELNTST